MIVPDTNLLIYAHIESMPHHAAANDWWNGVMNGHETVGLCWPVVTGFVRIASNRRVFVSPLTPDIALRICESWLARPTVQLIEPGPRHISLLRQFLEQTPGGDLVTDAHIAAISAEYSATIYSNDTDFARFSGIKWINPLK